MNCWQWINDVLRLAGLPKINRRISVAVAYAAGAAMEGLWTAFRRTDEPPMTRFLAAQLGTSHYFNIAAARRDLSYEPRISMEKGMQCLSTWLSPAVAGG